jgi:hypothetical protein
MGIAYNTNIVRNGLVLYLDAANPKSYSPNTFSKSLDIFGLTSSVQSATLSRDTATSLSPAGGIPMKMAVTGNDPHIGSYNSAPFNVAAAAAGQAWTLSVWVKASTATTGALFIFGAPASGNVFSFPDFSAGGINITTEWTRVSFTRTLTAAQTEFVQFRLDGPESGGSGINVWWDGLQFERSSTRTTFNSILNTNGVNWLNISGLGNNGTLTNGPTYSSLNNGSIVFDGTNDFVQCSGSVTTTAATFLAWIRRDGTQGQYDGILVSRGTNVSGMLFQLSNQLAYIWNDAFNAYNWQSGLTIPDLTWCMVAVSVTSTSATAYLCQASGITTATNTVSHTSTTLDDIKIAFDDAAARYFAGNIAIAQLYDRSLTAAEVSQNFNAVRGRYGI